ncbi:DUF3093 family protein [Streptomyces sp. NPDC006553]|uniref:DUF3093 family protein n=1 Tax=unclassified Streptomyces TaxID=2593676 RepID=UPI0022533BF4|nr:DUF3093 family protein [Streptomyces sp. NBC_00233]MCX5231578.1 DUF3093 domain-containing protein [Streptomyces sp. NBC_00233]
MASGQARSSGNVGTVTIVDAMRHQTAGYVFRLGFRMRRRRMRAGVPPTPNVPFEVVDPADPTPCVCLSTRTPEALGDAIAVARGA